MKRGIWYSNAIKMKIYNDWNLELLELAREVEIELKSIGVTIDNVMRAFDSLRKRVDKLEKK